MKRKPNYAQAVLKAAAEEIAAWFPDPNVTILLRFPDGRRPDVLASNEEDLMAVVAALEKMQAAARPH